MNIEDAKVIFGEWLPDRPYFDNPGLVEAKNVIPIDDNYKDFIAFSGANATLAATPIGAFAGIKTDGNPEIYVGTATDLYQELSGAWTLRSAATYAAGANGYWSFAQFDNNVYATDYSDRPQFKGLGTATAFATVTAAPFGRQIGVINRFLFLGDINDGATTTPWRVQWSSINDATDWPTPGTSTALARQAGQQNLDSSFGAVTGISGGQFYGVVFQQRAIHRFSYVGGNTVWQIDTIDRSHGCWAPRSLAQVGNISFFLAVDGFYMTDGQSVTPIGDGRVDKWFLSQFDQSFTQKMTSAVDLVNKCIYWSFPTTTSSGAPIYILVYNFARNKFSWADQAVQLLFSSYSTGYTLDQLDTLFTSIDSMSLSFDSSAWQGGTPVVNGFSGNQRGTFAGSALTATFETGESEPNAFGRTFIRGIQPFVTGNPSSIQVSVGTRSTQDNSSRSFSNTATPNSRTGICGFRTQGRYVSARMTIAGGFDRAIGLGIDLVPLDHV